MKYIPQKHLENLREIIQPGKVIVIYGPRRCGKTTLLNEFLKGEKEKYLFTSGEDVVVHDYLGSQSIEKIRSFVGDNALLVIDEAQKIKNIGTNLKLVVDHIKDVKVIATGSSSFDLAQHVGEPLTGRKYTLKLFPLAQLEIGQTENRAQTEANLENYLITERLKKQEYSSQSVNTYFWRTYDLKEIDLVEETAGHIHGYEMKWTQKKTAPPKLWLKTYPNASFQVISRDNYFQFIN